MLITNFASGELSPALNGRVDLRQYYQGASRIQNFEIIPTGGIRRRPGIKRLAQLDGESRIIPFIVNKNSVYVLQFITNPNYDATDPTSVASYIKVWKKNVVDVYTVIQTLNAPYVSFAEIKEIQYAQNYDTMIFVHKNYRPQILKEEAGTFTASAMDFDFIPDVELDDDFDYVMVVSGNVFPTKSGQSFTYKRLINGVPTDYTQTFNDNITDFYCIVEGKLYKWNVSTWKVTGQDPETETGLFTTATKYPGCVAFFNNRLFFAGTLHKPQMVWASAAPDNYGTRYNDFCTYKKFVTVNRVVKDADLHIFTCDIAQSDIDTVNHQTTLTNVTQDFTQTGTLKEAVTKYFVSSGLVPVGTKVVSVTSSTIVIDTDKINVAYTDEHTVETNVVMSIQLWRTVDTASADDYEYTVVANNITTADCSLFFEVASDENDAIMFISSNRFLAIGTESSIWSVDPGISALSINAVMQGRYGSDEIQGMAVETATVYFAQGCKGIREFYYNGESQAFQTNNIALLADHMLRESKAVDFDYMTNPYSRLLIAREDGTIAQMLYDKTNGIMAWSRIIHGAGFTGYIKSVAVTRGEDEYDLIFMVIKDGDNYFLELLDLKDANNWIDSWSVYNPNAENPTAGYQSSAILYNLTTDKTCPIYDIPTGFINTGDYVEIGYKYYSDIQSMPVINNDTSGKRRIVALQVRFLDSYLPICGWLNMPPEKFTTVPEVPYSGVAKVNFPGVSDRDVYFIIEANEPKPVNILSVDAITS